MRAGLCKSTDMAGLSLWAAVGKSGTVVSATLYPQVLQRVAHIVVGGFLALGKYSGGVKFLNLHEIKKRLVN